MAPQLLLFRNTDSDVLHKAGEVRIFNIFEDEVTHQVRTPRQAIVLFSLFSTSQHCFQCGLYISGCYYALSSQTLIRKYDPT